MEVAKRSLIGQNRKRACAIGLFTRTFSFCSPVSPAVFVLDSLKNCTTASKEAYLAIELDRAMGCNLEDSNLAAVIENYFEGRVEPVEVRGRGRGRPHCACTVWLSASGLSKLGKLTLCVIVYVMCK